MAYNASEKADGMMPQRLRDSNKPIVNEDERSAPARLIALQVPRLGVAQLPLQVAIGTKQNGLNIEP